MIGIRKYEAKDKPAALKILVETSRLPVATKEDIKTREEIKKKEADAIRICQI